MEQSVSVDFTSKILIIGNTEVGKSCILLRYASDKFDFNSQKTIGIDFKNKYVSSKSGIKIKLQLWDTAGQERFRPIISTFYKKTKACLVVFDMTNIKSALDVSYWMEQLIQNCDQNLPKVLVGNKYDLVQDGLRANDQNIKQGYDLVQSEVQKLKELYNVKYFEVSAKDSYNIDNAFQELVEQIVDVYQVQKCEDEEDMEDNDEEEEEEEEDDDDYDIIQSRDPSIIRDVQSNNLRDSTTKTRKTSTFKNKNNSKRKISTMKYKDIEQEEGRITLCEKDHDQRSKKKKKKSGCC